MPSEPLKIAAGSGPDGGDDGHYRYRACAFGRCQRSLDQRRAGGDCHVDGNRRRLGQHAAHARVPQMDRRRVADALPPQKDDEQRHVRDAADKQAGAGGGDADGLSADDDGSDSEDVHHDGVHRRRQEVLFRVEDGTQQRRNAYEQEQRQSEIHEVGGCARALLRQAGRDDGHQRPAEYHPDEHERRDADRRQVDDGAQRDARVLRLALLDVVHIDVNQRRRQRSQHQDRLQRVRNEDGDEIGVGVAGKAEHRRYGRVAGIAQHRAHQRQRADQADELVKSLHLPPVEMRVSRSPMLLPLSRPPRLRPSPPPFAAARR